MVIRAAHEQDIEFIISLTDTSNIERNCSRETGFVEFDTPTREEYALRMSSNPFFYIIEQEKTPIGFLASYPDSSLERLPKTKLLGYIKSKDPPFVYAEQVAILPKHKRKGHAKEAFARLFEDAERLGYVSIYGAVVQEPHQNKPMEKILHSLGFKPVGKQAEKGLLFDIYCHTVKCYEGNYTLYDI